MYVFLYCKYFFSGNVTYYIMELVMNILNKKKQLQVQSWQISEYEQDENCTYDGTTFSIFFYF